MAHGDKSGVAVSDLRAPYSVEITRRQWFVLLFMNFGVGLAHLAQAIAILVILKGQRIPVTFGFIAGPPGSGILSVPTVLFFMRMDIACAVFLLFAAVDHLVTIVPPVFHLYVDNVGKGTNPFRWIEYSVSASIMIVLISLLTGITELTALINMFGANSAMILFGLLMEQVNVGYLNPTAPRRVSWWPFIFGCIAGVFPWIAISVQLGETQTLCLGNTTIPTYTTIATTRSATTAPAFSRTCIPAFVFGVFASLLFCFNTFAINMALQ